MSIANFIVIIVLIINKNKKTAQLENVKIKNNGEEKEMLQYLQRIGKAIMLPIAALPVAGILLGVGGSLINIAALENAPDISTINCFC